MAKGCTKADRNRKSANNIAYKAQNRQEINKRKRIARHQKRMAKKAEKRARWEARKKAAHRVRAAA